MNIETILSELNLDYFIIGDEAFASCPYHKDRHPSWSVNTSTGLHHCFTCGFQGSLATLVSFVLGLPLAEAIAWVNSRAGMSKAKQWLESKGSQPPTELRLTNADLALFIPPPLSALNSRKVTEEAAERYEVLWNPKRDSWIFPIREPVDFGLMGWQEKNERRFRNYPVSCRKSETLFGIPVITDDRPVILVESPIDAVRCLSSRAGVGLSSYGVRVSDSQLSLIHSKSSRLILALDRDFPGLDETARVCREFKQLPISVFNYGNHMVKDIGDLTDEEIRLGIEKAIPSLLWMRDYKNGKITDYEGRRRG